MKRCSISGTLKPVYFQITDTTLQVAPLLKQTPAGAALRLEKARPNCETTPATPDLVWVVQQLAELAPGKMLEEVQRQNQELLRALAELKACQAKLEQLAPQTKPRVA